jgi:uncharacterized protein YbcC (UPF0753/DUF2309 family)
MNQPIEPGLRRRALLEPLVARACERIAPTWPLDQFIAVNPYWGFVDRPIADAAATLGSLTGTRLTMSRADFRVRVRSGAVTQAHLQAAIARSGSGPTVDALLASLDQPPRPLRPLPLVADLLDAERDTDHAPAWRDHVTHQVSQHCAAFFDRSQARWSPDRDGGLYASWQRQTSSDRSAWLLMGERGLAAEAAALPSDPLALIDHVVERLGVPDDGLDAYFTALLMSINGWASWCAYERWQARLAGRDDPGHGSHLLAIRLAWELMLSRRLPAAALARWAAGWAQQAARAAQIAADQATDWLLQQALEIAYQQPLCAALRASAGAAVPAAAPAVQAVFCIDVRSEVFRRALEAGSGGAVHTRGFAGFFGMPVNYRPLGTEMTRPQLPGLLAPARRVTDTTSDAGADGAGETSLAQALVARRRRSLMAQRHWQDLRGTASSAFSFVEALGLLYAGKLVQDSIAAQPATRTVEQTGLGDADLASLRPGFEPVAGEDPAWRVDLAAGVLGAIGLVAPFAPLVLLAGHGSSTTNNPHAAGLDCGACGGQTGEVNARVLAALLNDPAVRQGLQDRGTGLPDGTRFVAALHDTTTDDVRLFDTADLPASHAAGLRQLQAWLAAAGDRARAERAPSLGLAALRADAPALAQAVRERAADWAQVRPEWGLANNAAFIVAPRARTLGLDLQGRSFLHDYDWRRDTGYGVLELILTAPMLVTNWINLQYHASTLDNARYGSGDKLLHNVVGGRLGVFEGNGGDLRIGLPWQSLHDGRQLRHEPLRLSVFVAAPPAPIDAIIARHAVVRQLVEHEWLHLLRLDDDGSIWRRAAGGVWQAVPA